MFQPLLDAFIESAPIKKKLPLNLPPPPPQNLGANAKGAVEKSKKTVLISCSAKAEKNNINKKPKQNSQPLPTNLNALPTKSQLLHINISYAPLQFRV
ncbi:hypothetical protein C2R88_05860, partial [Helicobacter pylori]